ncbi:hypothetical protein FQN57_003167 [Myotisia sp. PD_48]|nr:hypothetical protein FQN57_003167 [Myotisia sp. PD_48]
MDSKGTIPLLNLITYFWIIISLSNGAQLTYLSHPAQHLYNHGDSLPLSCLNRSIDDGQHITDVAGNLQYIPFPLCNETAQPLTFHYGVSERIICTIDSLSDSLYHLLEYYIHSDVPLSCRISTLPFGHVIPPTPQDVAAAAEAQTHDEPKLGASTKAFTPLTFALQGTLQLSHLHIWTNTNVILHRSSAIMAPASKPSKHQISGQVVAGSAYSFPVASEMETGVLSLPDDPWAPGQGTKVVRGEPLTFTFNVGWTEDSDISLLIRRPQTGKWNDSSAFLLIVAGGVGALLALLWHRLFEGKNRVGSWSGDGLLGNSAVSTHGLFGRLWRTNAILGAPSASQKVNGYGGYGLNSAQIANGYTVLPNGKQD